MPKPPKADVKVAAKCVNPERVLAVVTNAAEDARVSAPSAVSVAINPTASPKALRVRLTTVATVPPPAAPARD